MNEDAVAPWVAHNKDRELLQLTLNKKSQVVMTSF